MSSMMKVVLGIIGITVSLILFPIIITQANVLYDAAGTTYTGLRSIVQIAPLIILVGLTVGSGWLTVSGIRQTRRRRSRR